jgi:hypothetical protein
MGQKVHTKDGKGVMQRSLPYSLFCRVKRSTELTSCLSTLEALELFVAYIIIRVFGEVNGANTVFCEEKHRILNYNSERIPHPDLSRFVGVYRNWSFEIPLHAGSRAG